MSASIQVQEGELVGQCETCDGLIREENIEIGPNAIARYCGHCDDPLKQVKEMREAVEAEADQFAHKDGDGDE